MNRRHLVGVLACGLLAACGPDGNGPDPTPSPTATPSPTPAPSPTPTPSPTPSPTPTPPPTGTNTSLLGPLSSETFLNAATYTQYGGGFSSFGGLTNALRFEYDAPSRTYTVASTTSQRSLRYSFPSLSQVVAETTDQFIVYRIIGSADPVASRPVTLILSRPGTSGAFRYRYVGGGELIEREQSRPLMIHMFTYGVATPGSRIPASGSYNLDFVGHTETGNPDVRCVDKAQLTITGSNFTVSYVPTPGIPACPSSYDWIGASGSIAADGTFSGMTNSRLNEPLPVGGRFFGPNGEEVGLVFGGKWGSGAAVANAYLIGRRT